MELQKLYDSVDSYHDDMLAMWEKLVMIESGSGNKAGVDAVGQAIADFLNPLGITTHFYEEEEKGNMLVAEFGDMSQPFLVFLGHMDTVFKDGTIAERPFTIRDGKAFGPGVLDMKGGVTIALFALKALQENGFMKHPVKLILSGYEEVANTATHAVPQIKKECCGAIAAFNFETGFRDHSIVVERKGLFRARFDVEGIGAHAGNNPQDGRSAIAEMAYKILELEALSDYEQGNTVNVGIIEGGTVANAVPEHCSVVVDVRFVNETANHKFKQKFREIADQVHVEGTKTVVTFPHEFSAMSPFDKTMELFHQVNAIVQQEGFAPLTAKRVGGASDSAYSVAAGVPTLCAMGVQGTGNHTVKEEADVASLFTRTKMILAIVASI